MNLNLNLIVHWLFKGNLMTEKTKDIYKLYIESINDKSLETSYLIDILNKIKKETPETIVDYKIDDSLFEIDDNKINWSASYFSKQMKLAEYNFSIKRLEHILEIRERFRQNGIKGFVPLVEKKDNNFFESNCMKENISPSDNLINFVNKGDLLEIRTALQLDLNNNRLSKEKILAGVKYAKNKKSDLFLAYEEKSFSYAIDEDRDNWSVDYYNGQIVSLKVNFSEERLLHLIEIRSSLREKGIDGFVAVEPKVKSSTSSIHQQDKKSERSEQSPRPTQSSEGMDPLFKTALKIGGAIAALAIILIAVIRE